MVDGIQPNPVPEREEGNPTPRVDLLHPNTSDANTPPPVIPPAEPAPAAEQPAAPLPPTPSFVDLAPPGHPVPPSPTPPKRRNLPLLIAAGVFVLLVIGGGVYWFTRPQASEPEAPSTQKVAVDIATAKPTSLVQRNAQGLLLSSGAATSGSAVSFSFSKPAGDTADWSGEIEVQPLATAFTSQPSTGTQATVSGNVVTITLNALTDGDFHWQARFSKGTNVSTWAAYGENEETVADFTIDAKAPAVPVITSVEGKAVTPGATSVSITGNRPVITGTAEAGSRVALQLQPNSLSFDTVTDTSGNWTITPNTDVPNGDTTLTATATDAAGNVGGSGSLTLAINSAPTAEAVEEGLAPTGEMTGLWSLLGLMMMIGSVLTLGLVRRHARD